jgi:hypothetical protein
MHFDAFLTAPQNREMFITSACALLFAHYTTGLEEIVTRALISKDDLKKT